MHRVYRLMLLATVAALLFGCSRQDAQDSVGQATLSDVELLSLAGVEEAIAIGDPLTLVESAFPEPEGAVLHKTGSTFGSNFTNTYSWTSRDGSETFEAATDDSQVRALAHMISPATSGFMQSAVDAYGTPEIEAEGEYTQVAAWKQGNNMRFHLVSALLQFTGEESQPTVETYQLVLIASEETLREAGFDPAKPAEIVERLDGQIANALAGPGYNQRF